MTSSFQGSLRFRPPKNFNGKEDEFDQFSYKLRAYMALSNPKFRKLMVTAQESEDAVDFDILEADEQIMLAQLQMFSYIYVTVQQLDLFNVMRLSSTMDSSHRV